MLIIANCDVPTYDLAAREHDTGLRVSIGFPGFYTFAMFGGEISCMISEKFHSHNHED